MIKSLGKLLALSLSMMTAWASVARADLPPGPLPMNEMRLTNRAQCAIDSDFPTTSAFTIIDGFNAGELSYGWAQNLQVDAGNLANTGMKEFRLVVAGLQTQIIQKLLNGQLPLLPNNISQESQTNLSKYKALAQQCGADVFCDQLRDYVGQLWNQSSDNLASANRLTSLQKLDSFSNQNFVPKSLKAQSSCLYLKKFSPLQSQLQATNLNGAQLGVLAQSVMHAQDYLTDCLDQDPALDSRNSALEVDLKVGNTDVWNKVGFDFWNSVRIYLSWAWRFAPDVQHWSPQFSQIFRNLNLEESIMFLPNGCKSITPPKCDSQTLSVNALRELAKQSGTLTEFDDLIPKGEDKNLIDRGARSVNDDFLGTTSYDKASKWVDNFRKNFVQTRWIMKNKIFNANQYMTIIAGSYSPQELVEYIKPLLLTGTPSVALKNEAAYMCLEARLSGDKHLDFLRSDIDRVAQLENMERTNVGVGLTVDRQIQYFQDLIAAITPVCDQLEQSQFFRANDYRTNWIGLEAWAKELTKQSMPTDPTNVAFTPYTPATGVFLTVGSDNTPLCQNPMDCARKIFKSAVDLYDVSEYADAFLADSHATVTAPDVFNPYAELKACKVYDPWYQTNRTRKVFLADMANATLFGWNPIPVYLDADFTAPKVTSFNKLVQDGKLKFDPNIEKSKVSAALIADFGPLLGTPCAIQIAPSANQPFNFYAFNGISLNYCKVRATRGGIAEDANSFQADTPKEGSVCGGCTMNFVGVASSVAVVDSAMPFNPLKFGVYIFRAFYRFVKGMKDNVNVPRTYQFRLDYVVDAYQRYKGNIPDSCVMPLGQGLRCYQDICASKLAQFAEQTFGKQPVSVRWSNDGSGRVDDNRKMGSITTGTCNGEIQVPFRCDRFNGDHFVLLEDMTSSSSSCRREIQRHR